MQNPNNIGIVQSQIATVTANIHTFSRSSLCSYRVLMGQGGFLFSAEQTQRTNFVLYFKDSEYNIITEYNSSSTTAVVRAVARLS